MNEEAGGRVRGTHPHTHRRRGPRAREREKERMSTMTKLAGYGYDCKHARVAKTVPKMRGPHDGPQTKRIKRHSLSERYYE